MQIECTCKGKYRYPLCEACRDYYHPLWREVTELINKYPETVKEMISH